MPKTKINYENTIIYKIIKKNDDDFIYINNTTNYIKRKYEHKKYYIKNNVDFNDYKMIFIENFPCKNQLEADKRIDELRKTIFNK
jgi:hypothetical protein